MQNTAICINKLKQSILWKMGCVVMLKPKYGPETLKCKLRSGVPIQAALKYYGKAFAHKLALPILKKFRWWGTVEWEDSDDIFYSCFASFPKSVF